jgi:hypothetical protein
MADNRPLKNEFKNKILRLVTTNSGASPQNATLVHKLFEGVLTSETKCLTCKNVSTFISGPDTTFNIWF